MSSESLSELCVDSTPGRVGTLAQTRPDLFSLGADHLSVIRRNGEVPFEHSLLDVVVTSGVSSACLLRHSPEVDALSPFPRLNTEEEENGGDEDDTPFPADTLMLEDHLVDDRDVKDGEDGDKPGHDSEEEELVTPYIDHPLGEVLLRARLHAEKGTTHIDHLPREEEGKPGKTCETGGAGAENCVTAVGVGVVAEFAEVSVAPGIDYEGEGGQAEGGDPNSVEDHVTQDFESEDSAFEL